MNKKIDFVKMEDLPGLKAEFIDAIFVSFKIVI